MFYVNDTIRGFMMWMSFAMNRNKQEKKWLAIEHKALKWVKMNNVGSKGSPWRIPMVDGMIMTSRSRLWWL